jgi:hypothetical protein
LLRCLLLLLRRRLRSLPLLLLRFRLELSPRDSLLRVLSPRASLLRLGELLRDGLRDLLLRRDLPLLRDLLCDLLRDSLAALLRCLLAGCDRCSSLPLLVLLPPLLLLAFFAGTGSAGA